LSNSHCDGLVAARVATSYDIVLYILHMCCDIACTELLYACCWGRKCQCNGVSWKGNVVNFIQFFIGYNTIVTMNIFIVVICDAFLAVNFSATTLPW